MNFVSLSPYLSPDIWRSDHWFPAKWRLRNERRNSILMTRHCFWLVLRRKKFYSTNQNHDPDLGSDVSYHQYGISALVSHTSLGGKPVVATLNVGCFLRLYLSCRFLMKLMLWLTITLHLWPSTLNFMPVGFIDLIHNKFYFFRYFLRTRLKRFSLNSFVGLTSFYSKT